MKATILCAAALAVAMTIPSSADASPFRSYGRNYYGGPRVGVGLGFGGYGGYRYGGYRNFAYSGYRGYGGYNYGSNYSSPSYYGNYGTGYVSPVYTAPVYQPYAYVTPPTYSAVTDAYGNVLYYQR